MKRCLWLITVILLLWLLSACTPASQTMGKAPPTAQGQPAACVLAAQGSSNAPLQPTTIATLEQAYWCLFDHYVTGKTLDDRVLLNGAFIGFVQELLRQGLDQPAAMLPALTGNRQADWQVTRRPSSES